MTKSGLFFASPLSEWDLSNAMPEQLNKTKGTAYVPGRSEHTVPRAKRVTQPALPSERSLSLLLTLTIRQVNLTP